MLTTFSLKKQKTKNKRTTIGAKDIDKSVNEQK